MEVQVTTDPVKLPLDVKAARVHLQIEHTDDDAYIQALIRAATNIAQTITHRKFITQTLTLYLDASEMASPIKLPYPPQQSLTSFEYYDSDRTATTVDSTGYDAIGTNSMRIVSKNGGWQNHQAYQSHKIVYTTGYGLTGESVPDDIIHAIKIIVADLWNNPESSKKEMGTQLTSDQIPFVARTLLEPYRVLI